MPRFSNDDVLDFMVLEALHARGNEDVKVAQKEAERKNFRNSHKGFDPNNPQGG